MAVPTLPFYEAFAECFDYEIGELGTYIWVRDFPKSTLSTEGHNCSNTSLNKAPHPFIYALWQPFLTFLVLIYACDFTNY